MFKELYTMIDELHTITNSPQFTSMRYRHAMNKISDAYEAVAEKIERALLPAIMRFAELYTKTKTDDLP